MKLVETDIRHAEDDAPEATTPPRPEHRRVYVSLLLTLSVLAATVVTVYALFPKRDNEVLTVAIAAHEEPGELELERPDATELSAWSVGVVGRGVSWPAAGRDLEVLGTRRIEILRRPAAMVRYRAGNLEVTLVVMRAHVSPGRLYRRESDGLLAVSWRRGKFTMVAVGPRDAFRQWGLALGVP